MQSISNPILVHLDAMLKAELFDRAEHVYNSASVNGDEKDYKQKLFKIRKIYQGEINKYDEVNKIY